MLVLLAVVIFVLPFISFILQPLLIPAAPAAEFGSTKRTLKSPSTLKNTNIPKSPGLSSVTPETQPIPLLIKSHSVFFIPKLHLSTGDPKPGSRLNGLIAVITAAGSA